MTVKKQIHAKENACHESRKTEGRGDKKPLR